MIFLLSPAKTLDFEAAAPTEDFSLPRMLDDSTELIEGLRKLSKDDIASLMSVSEKIAQLNASRFEEWSTPFDLKNAKQALFAFKGDVYTGLSADTATSEQVEYIQRHARILSGLYGILKPLDLIQPYRLEMGTRFENNRGSNLYQFWGESVTALLNDDLAAKEEVVNLASNEYFKSVKPKLLQAEIITPVFKDLKGGKYKIVSFYAKKARGLMLRYAADNQIEESKDLKGFDYAGYQYNDSLSSESEWVFTRDEAPK